jgi:uncharacterized protein YbaP (TraB family)
MSHSKNSLLWRVSKPGLPDSYLFGTMHVRDQRAFRYLPIVKENILTCDIYAAELNLDEIDQQIMAEAMDLDDDVRLSDLLKSKVYKRLERLFFAQTGFPLEYFEGSQPIMITNLLTESVLAKDAPHSLDATLWKFARENDKITIGIETFEEQLVIMDKISLDYQVKGLSEMVRNFKKFKKQLRELTELYQSGALRKLYKRTKKQAGPLRKLMIYNRNFIMAERIAQFANEKSIFVAVGAGHLEGSKGILRLLKMEGFKCSPVKMPV